MDINKISEKLKKQIPQQVIDELPYIVEKYKINNVLRLSHFLAQCAHESGNFTRRTENLNYSAKRLTEVFPKYFKTIEKATEFQRKPEKIANHVYANRMGNGPESSGMGWRFIGRGYLQLTGFENYSAFGKSIGVDVTKNPELVATKYPLTSAAWFFASKGVNKLCDSGASVAAVTAVSIRVNGGKTNLDDRIAKFNKFYALLMD